ncbi:hypothetical protein FKM82_026146 [Ascaphus truei]
MESAAEKRFGKNKRLRQAKEEATAEIDQYKLKRESDFRRIQTSIMGSQGNLAVKIEEQTGEQIQSHNAFYQKHKENVLTEILHLTSDIKPEIHINYQYQ